MYIVGQEETVGESSVSVVAGVRTVTTNMDGRDALPRLSRPFAFSITPFGAQVRLLSKITVDIRAVESETLIELESR